MKKMVAILKRKKKIKMLFFGCQTNRLDMRKTDSIIKNAVKDFTPNKMRYTASDQKILKILCIF